MPRRARRGKRRDELTLPRALALSIGPSANGGEPDQVLQEVSASTVIERSAIWPDGQDASHGELETETELDRLRADWLKRPLTGHESTPEVHE
jgi:hypothetical protein